MESIASDAPDTFQKILNIARQRLRHDQLRALLPNLFGSLDKTELDYIEKNSEWVHLGRGEILCRQCDPGDCLYIVVSGRLQAVKEDENHDKTDLGTIGRGEILGEMALLTGGVRSATLFARRESDLLKISADVFDRLAAAHPRAILSIGQTLAKRILKSENPCHDSPNPVNLAIVAITPDVNLSDFSSYLAEKLSDHVRTLHLSSRQVCGLFGLRCIEHIKDENPFSVRLSAWLNEQESCYDIMVCEADPALSPWTRQCLQNADKILVLIAGNKPSPGICTEWITFFQNECSEASSRTLVFIHPEGTTRPLNTDQWLRVIPASEHYHVISGRNTDTCRLARLLTGKAINIVFSGGAACGLSHIGVIRALEECDIPIDSVCGTSMGAVIASQYAMGMGYADLLRTNRWLWVLSKPMKDITLPMISFLRGQKFNLAAKSIFQDKKIEDLWLPFFCISTNLTTASAMIHRKGSLFDAVRATSSVPGLVPPVVLNNEILVDGGIMNNMPVEIARRFFKGKVIAVDVTNAKALSTSLGEFPSPWKILRDRMMPSKNRNSVPNILDILYRSAVVGSRQKTEQARLDADLHLRLPLDRFKFLEFESFDEIVETGYQYGKEKIQEWKDSLT
jgi:NTE family protein/lysophospholipid hydrolase